MNILFRARKNTYKSVEIKFLNKIEFKKSSTFDFIKIKSVLRDVIFKKTSNKINNFAGIMGEMTKPYGGSISVYEKNSEKLSGIVPVILDKIKKEGCI